MECWQNAGGIYNGIPPLNDDLRYRSFAVLAFRCTVKMLAIKEVTQRLAAEDAALQKF